MSDFPKVAFGAPLFNNARNLPQALESLLSQTYGDFRVVLVDDCSADATPIIAERYSQTDPRIVYVRNHRRLGYLRNARRAFDIARERFPSIIYFAWASDHDVWHPRWLETMMVELERDPEIVLAYPLTVRLSEAGEFRWAPRTFDTHGITHSAQRFRSAFWGMAAGDMIYGLFRRDVLEKVECMPPVLLPDRFLLAEASLYGRFKQVPEVLWYRRYWGLASYERQRIAFFPDGYPIHSYLPWWTTHTALFFHRLVLRGVGRPQVGRARGAYVSWLYCASAVRMEVRRWFSWTRRLHRWVLKRLSRQRKALIQGLRKVMEGHSKPQRSFVSMRHRTAAMVAAFLMRHRLVRAFVKRYLVPLVADASHAPSPDGLEEKSAVAPLVRDN